LIKKTNVDEGSSFVFSKKMKKQDIFYFEIQKEKENEVT
jgi:hypothetical protein